MSMKFVPMLTLLLPLLHTLHALLSGEKRLIILKKYYSCLMKFLKSICHDIMAIVTCTRSWHLFFSHRWHSRTHHSISLKSVCGARCEHLTATSYGPLCGTSTTFLIFKNVILFCKTYCCDAMFLFPWLCSSKYLFLTYFKWVKDTTKQGFRGLPTIKQDLIQLPIPSSHRQPHPHPLRVTCGLLLLTKAEHERDSVQENWPCNIVQCHDLVLSIYLFPIYLTLEWPN